MHTTYIYGRKFANRNMILFQNRAYVSVAIAVAVGAAVAPAAADSFCFILFY